MTIKELQDLLAKAPDKEIVIKIRDTYSDIFMTISKCEITPYAAYLHCDKLRR